ncbi:MAG TPA: HAMP domain-containing sensor histidine kinase [Thermoanaerobaculia bacterium]|nr:HAMP domain-containing sensor histidine kinase [Thermoanaerobaculia bacterium]
MRIGAGVKRRTLWVGFLAVLAPLLVLLFLQYRWLVKIDKSSKIVHKAQLASFLEAATQNVEYTYKEKAQRALDIPPSVFTQDQLERAAHQFKKKGVEGARRLFVMSFMSDTEPPLYFESSCTSFSTDTLPSEAQAVWVATAPWRALAHKGAVVERVRLTAEERDPNYRILLYPITDDSSRLVGISGMILDEDYFRWKVLPEAIKKALSDSFEGAEQYEPVVSVKNGDGEVVFATGKSQDGKIRENESEKSFSFVFTDWSLGLASRHTTPALVARRSFLINTGLSAALAAALLGGIVLSLRTASREMKLSQMKNEFVSNVSHELRTPLASIRVFGEFLRLGRVDNPEKIRAYGDYIENESRRLTQLINNILDFASIESGRKTYRFERCDVRDVVCETLKTFEVRLRQSGFSIVLEGGDTPLPPARIDTGAVAQSLSNLLDNAVKYSRDNKDVIVRLRREGDFIVISVKDHGIGIPRDEQAKIFDRFHRVSTGLVHDVKGSGLGLSIVRHIVEAHHGKVTVESRQGEGSMFSIHLPIELPVLQAAPETAEAPRERPSEA